MRPRAAPASWIPLARPVHAARRDAPDNELRRARHGALTARLEELANSMPRPAGAMQTVNLEEVVKQVLAERRARPDSDGTG